MVIRYYVNVGLLAGETPIDEHSIPISEYSNQAMLGQLNINKRLQKTCMVRRPVKKAPTGNMTNSSLSHTVSPLLPTPPQTDAHAHQHTCRRAGRKPRS